MKKIVILFVGMLLLVNPVVLSCTVFHVSNDNVAFGGNNEDHFNNDTHIYFYPPTNNKYGKVIVGYSGAYRVQGGMNEKGVFWDGLSCPYHEVLNSTDLPNYPRDIFEHILDVCETCDEAIEILGQYNLQFLEYAQVLVGDRFGESFIIEGDVIHHKNKFYQVATNFLLSQHPNPPYPCWRYTTASTMFEDNGADNISAEFCASVLDAVHLQGAYPTQYSTVYDLKNKLIYLYYNHTYDQVKVFNISEEFLLGYHSYSIPQIFEEPPINHEPMKPNQPSGQIHGKIGQEYLYKTNTTDPDGDRVYYLWDWGDGNNSGWLGPNNSGTIYEAKHTWNVKDSYNVKVKAKDTFGAESPWSDPLPITMPYSYNKKIPQFIELLSQRFPNAFPLPSQLLGY